MDGLSSGAGVIAVVSLAMQLADSIKQLYEFWNSIEEAPEHIMSIATDLGLLSGVLTKLALEAQLVQPDETLSAILKTCTDKVRILTLLTDDMESGFASKSFRIRKWTALKTVLKSEKIERLQDGVERLKSSLLLVQQHHHGRLSRIRYENHQQSLAAVIQHLSGLGIPQSSTAFATITNEYSDHKRHTTAPHGETPHLDRKTQTPAHLLNLETYSKKDVYKSANLILKERTLDSSNLEDLKPDSSDILIPRNREKKRLLWKSSSALEYFFGTIFTNSRTYSQGLGKFDEEELDNKCKHYELRTSFTIRPAAWMIRLGFNYGLYVGTVNSSIQGWKQSISTFHTIPDDSLIFQFCKEGNLSGVRDLISRGLASVRDTNITFGRTPLHVAAENGHLELCKYLISKGADRSIRADAGLQTGIWSPARSAAVCVRDTTEVNLSHTVDLMRLFVDYLDFYNDDGDGWTVFRQIADAFNAVAGQFEAKVSLLKWLIRLLSVDLRSEHAPEFYAKTLDDFMPTFYFGPADAVSLLLELWPKEAIDARPFPTGYTLLHKRLAQARRCFHGRQALSAVFSLKPNLHVIGLDHYYSPRRETPMSLAMYSAWTFWNFRNGVRSMQVNIDELIVYELGDDRPLTNAGWEIDTLRVLVEFYIEPELFGCNDWSTWEHFHIDSNYCSNADKCNINPYSDFCCEAFSSDVCSDCGDSSDGVEDHQLEDAIRVQPYWQHVLDLIRQRKMSSTLGDTSKLTSLARKQVQSPVKTWPGQASHQRVPTTTLFPDHSSSESQYSTPRDESTFPQTNDSNFIYKVDETLCIWCWLNFKETGQRYSRRSAETESYTDDSEEFSPYLIHG